MSAVTGRCETRGATGASFARTGQLAVISWAFLLALCSGTTAGEAVEGDWVGHYTCMQGTTGLMLHIEALSEPRIRALFHFYADASNPTVPEGCFEMAGTFDPATRRVDLRAGRWLLRPYGYVTVDLRGEVSGGMISGIVVGPSCGRFELYSARGRSQDRSRRVPVDRKHCRLGGSALTVRGEDYFLRARSRSRAAPIIRRGSSVSYARPIIRIPAWMASPTGIASHSRISSFCKRIARGPDFDDRGDPLLYRRVEFR